MLNAHAIDYSFEEIEPDVEPVSTAMLTDWTDAKTAAFQKEIMGFSHNLRATGLFTDEALIDLLERHPSEKMDVCTMSAPDHPIYPNKFRTGDFDFFACCARALPFR